ncbi:hypothetical protein [Nitrosospira sp. NRS527]|uniref:hypothetical protein n=1 Tax=Nitrosospira sp. NRS527 TaxID=155925 RepID=UPI001AF23E73|nr:hypothetical protein [Nitrosospira sp. NRS527]BCT69516.1 hypothetical protein NNRS527_03141 [Nitrosospira sp. NRS527]
MINIKAIWLYVIVAASISVGYGGAIATSPSNSEIEQALTAARAAAQKTGNCEESASDREFRRVKPQNTPTKGF